MHDIWNMITEVIRYLIFGWFIYIAFSVGYKKAVEHYSHRIIDKLKIITIALLTIIMASCFYGFVLLGSQYQDSFTGEDIFGYEVVINLNERLLETGFMFMILTLPYLAGWFKGWDTRITEEKHRQKTKKQEGIDKNGFR
jgi:hypothetical protein